MMLHMSTCFRGLWKPLPERTDLPKEYWDSAWRLNGRIDATAHRLSDLECLAPAQLDARIEREDCFIKYKSGGYRCWLVRCVPISKYEAQVAQRKRRGAEKGEKGENFVPYDEVYCRVLDPRDVLEAFRET